MNKPVIYAHRGSPKVAPENTMAAFRKAVEVNADGIELDVHLTGDSQLVVTHDAILGRVCNGKGMIKNQDVKQLNKLDFGSWFSDEFANEKIPMLKDVINFAIDNNIVLNLEIKAQPNEYAPGVEKALAELIGEMDFLEKVIVSSFNHHCLLAIKEISPDIMIAPLFIGLFTNIVDYALEIGAYAIHPYMPDVTRSLVEKCHYKNIKVNPWVVNKKEDLLRMIDYGVDGIITDYPELALGLI